MLIQWTIQARELETHLKTGLMKNHEKKREGNAPGHGKVKRDLVGCKLRQSDNVLQMR